MALRHSSIPTSEERKKISSMDSSQRNPPSLSTMRSSKPDPVSSIIRILKPQHYSKPNSDPTHTQAQFLTKSSSLSSTTNSSSLQPQQQLKPKKEKTKLKKAPVEEKLVIEEDEEPKRTSISSIVSVGRRKSFCDSKIELKEFLASATARIVAVDMPPFMQIHAVSCARKAQDNLEKHSPRTLASTLKKEFDGVYGPAWHCIVGTSFGSFVTHSVDSI